jgi:hypothetical protein
MAPRNDTIPLSIRTGLSVALLLPILQACGPPGSPVTLTQFRDSAGVVIAESSGLPEPNGGGWSLAQTPFLTIGTFQGDSLYQFYEISGGIRLPDGRIVVSDQGSHQLRIFGPEGHFLQSWGREGEGPGEFRAIRLVGRLGEDTLVVVDGRQRRISLFHPDRGRLGQSTVAEEVGLTFVSSGMFADGSVVFGGGLTLGPGGEIPSEGLNRPDTRYVVASLDGRFAADLGTFPGPEIFVQTQGGGGEFLVAASSIPFGRRPVAAAGGDRFFVGTGDTHDIRVLDPAGRLLRIFRILQSPPPVTSEALNRWIEERVAELDDPSGAPALRTSLREMPTPGTMPAHQGLTVDQDGCLWVEGFRQPGEGLRSWTIFDREGTPQARLSLSSDHRILEVGRDYVLTVFQDPMEVEYLRLHALVRGRQG